MSWHNWHGHNYGNDAEKFLDVKVDIDVDIKKDIETYIDYDLDVYIDVKIEGNTATGFADAQAFGDHTVTDVELYLLADEYYSSSTADGLAFVA